LLDLEPSLQMMADHLGTEFVELHDLDLPGRSADGAGVAARMHQCIPVALHGSSVRMLWRTPLNPSVIGRVELFDGKEVQVVVGDPAQIEKAINKFTANKAKASATSLRNWGPTRKSPRKWPRRTSADGPADLEDLANEPPIIKFVMNLVLYQAVQDRASDIHFEPFRGRIQDPLPVWTARCMK